MKQKVVAVFALGLLMTAGCTNYVKQPEKTNAAQVTPAGDPLSSWNSGDIKDAIIKYVQTVTDSADKSYIPVQDRIATFDNDGTLWAEQPVYFQFFYALDKVREMAGQHPEWKTTEPFKSALMNDMGGIMRQGEKGVLAIVAATHAGMTTSQFDSSVAQWIDTAVHPIKKMHYNAMVYQPMLELIKYLQTNQFKVFIVSGGGIDFMRAWAENVYGIPKDQIVGSSIKSKYEYNNGQPEIIKLAELDFIDDHEGKPVGIQKFIGRKPVFACGNSDGDLQMLQWAASNKYSNLELYIHHTDADREWAYDRKSAIGKLDAGLDEAQKKNWLVADMKRDWKTMFPEGK
ncbi:haloacid dehalogenase-like hydrolase [Chitinophaga jiangningensis]|uniref:phosphoserine phosphatase n=1 Tax=Chitinophaga jiangningensis TaxID=1419482 RepID=A0A1M7C3H6_9BACT|nr:HAD family hydrolase [Chitinophaga jiangningensis]SHL61774.1 haloacid dehalogenase-like hydrolase [Chitinophaga jiangningensis]